MPNWKIFLVFTNHIFFYCLSKKKNFIWSPPHVLPSIPTPTTIFIIGQNCFCIFDNLFLKIYLYPWKHLSFASSGKQVSGDWRQKSPFSAGDLSPPPTSSKRGQGSVNCLTQLPLKMGMLMATNFYCCPQLYIYLYIGGPMISPQVWPPF